MVLQVAANRGTPIMTVSWVNDVWEKAKHRLVTTIMGSLSLAFFFFCFLFFFFKRFTDVNDETFSKT